MSSDVLSRINKSATLVRLVLPVAILAPNYGFSPAFAQSAPKDRAKSNSQGPAPDAVCQTCGGGGGGGGGTNDVAPTPPEKFALSPGDVDMRSGIYKYHHVDLSIGGTDGLSVERFTQHDHLNGYAVGVKFNWDIYLEQLRIKVATANSPQTYDYQVSVYFGDLSSTFRSTYPAQAETFAESSFADKNSLTFTSSGTQPYQYTFIANDGTSVEFQPPAQAGTVFTVKPTHIIKPDGTTITFGYGSDWKSIVSNRGYALLYNVSGSNSRWCAINLAIMPMPTVYDCPSGAISSSYSSTSFTDQSGVPTTWNGLASIYAAGASSPYLINAIDARGAVASQQFADGRVYQYQWTNDPNNVYTSRSDLAGGSYTDQNSNSVAVQYGSYRSPAYPTELTWQITPGPERITDELGRVTVFNYCPVSQGSGCAVQPRQSRTNPEGDGQAFEYDIRRNILHTTFFAKPSSQQASYNTYATYDCTYPVSCAKPTSVTDARGQVTNYTYDTTHGGVLTETLPADVSGVHPVKRYAYVQRYAWIVSGSGGYMHAGDPVWLLASEKTCRTSATSGDACAGGSGDEVVTAYDYGPDTGAVGNNLLLRGVAVTADGATRRTCYGYDGVGNRISETKPRAGLTVCP